MWAMLVAVVAVVLVNRVQTVDDFMAKKVFLKTPASYVNLTSEAWKVHDGDTEITIAVRFKPNTKVGQVFSLRAIAPHGRKIAKLVGSLHNGYLQLNLLNTDGISILNKPFSTHFLDQNKEHSLAVRLNTKNNSLFYRLESDSDHVCEITEEIDIEGVELVPTLGDGGNSMIGCVTLVTVQVGGATPPYEVIEISSNEIDECPSDDECAYRDCNKGRCLPLEVATCDCYGTHKSGPNCRYPSRSVFVLNNDDESQPSNIRYTPWKVDQQISRITIDFKFAELDNKQGVLLHSILNDGSVVKLYVVERNGNLLFGSFGHVNFTLDTSVEFHSIFIGIHHESRMIGLTVDGETRKLSFMDSPVGLHLSSILFGGAPATNGARELGITACLKNVYVDHHDILYMLNDKDKRVESSKSLSSCSNDGSLPNLIAVGVPLFNADPLPNDLFDFISSQDNSSDVDATSGNEPNAGSSKIEISSQLSPTMQHLTVASENIHKGGIFASGPRKGPTNPLPCEKSQDYVCRNGAICERRQEGPVCLCKRGFAGKYCQFVLHPRTCAEANTFYGLPSGPTHLDVDGTRPLLGSVAVCRNGITTVPHDMPNGTVLRSSEDKTNSLFVVSYRDFNNEKLARLIKNSDSCKQFVQYDCNNAALGFELKKTWFHVATSDRTVAQIGRVPNSCTCMDLGCIENKKCNCDSRAITNDIGFLYGEDAGITRIVALHSDGDVNGKMTLGPLECEGFAGYGPIRFARERALDVRRWSGELLSLQFRTANSTATLFSVIEDEQKYLKVELVNGHMIRVSLSNASATVESQARINDTKWHLLVLEFANDELRIGIDSFNAFVAVSSDDIPDGQLSLNDDINGFTGCVQSLIIDDDAVHLQGLAQEFEEISPYCEDRCNGNLCQNSAECIQDFAADAAVCRCRNPNVQSGRNCENDINQNSSVSFHGGFLKYELSQNPLIGQTVLSFRTDQSQALIIFVHDHNNNFMQLHLAEEVNLTLSLNNEDIVSSCTVRARPGTEYSNMNWIQGSSHESDVVRIFDGQKLCGGIDWKNGIFKCEKWLLFRITIEHSLESSTLTVDDDACIIHTPRQLSQHPVQKFINVFTDIVVIPVGLNSPIEPKPFVYTFVGGIERESHTSDGSMVLRPIYQCAVPNLLGCVRGLRIGGEIVDLRQTGHGFRPNDPKLIRIGCELGCSSLDCKNSGHCSVGWLGNGDVTCDCSRTSYAGSDCTVDNGLILAANSYFTFDMDRFLSRYILSPMKRTQTLQFAFAPSSPSTHHQILATVQFKDERIFEVVLNRNGSVNVGIVDGSKKGVVKTFVGNFSDGYRHFFVARFGAHQATAVTVDAIRHDFEFMAENLDLYNAKEIVLGGQKSEKPEITAQSMKNYYNGCVSNLDVDFNIPALRATPISYLNEDVPSLANYSWLTPTISVVRGRCAPFRIPNSLPVYHDPVELPIWETNFQRHVYQSDSKDPLAIGEDGNTWLWAIGIIIVVMLLLLAAIVIICCCCLLGTKSSDKPVISKDEEEPLRILETPPPSLIEQSRASEKLVTFSEPNSTMNNHVPSKKEKDPIEESLSENDVDEESEYDLDATLRDIGDENFDMRDVTRPQSFIDRSSPRLSSFRQGDPTVPKDSPLYAPISPNRSARPIPTPVPPPRISS
ncbi:hypothetical protein RB195_007484 [Necator americanus]|uniref:Laminin G domain protein n=1 Tax=Necator americanus TaxID=51031 RepID=A0ABR1BXH1_NECAM